MSVVLGSLIIGDRLIDLFCETVTVVFFCSRVFDILQAPFLCDSVFDFLIFDFLITLTGDGSEKIKIF